MKLIKGSRVATAFILVAGFFLSLDDAFASKGIEVSFFFNLMHDKRSEDLTSTPVSDVKGPIYELVAFTFWPNSKPGMFGHAKSAQFM